LTIDALEKREISESKKDIRAVQRIINALNKENEGVRGRKPRKKTAIGRVRHA
jgi:hypothetical protein